MIEDLGSQFSNVGNTTLIRAPITLIHHTLDYHSMAVSWFITNNLKKIDKTRENYCLPSGNSSVTGIKKDDLNPAVNRFSREPVPLFGVRHRVNCYDSCSNFLNSKLCFFSNKKSVVCYQKQRTSKRESYRVWQVWLFGGKLL